MDENTRDMFAAMALMGMLAGRAGANRMGPEYAKTSFDLADAMMAERKKRDEQRASAAPDKPKGD